MGRKVPDTTAPKYDTKQNECTCEEQQEYIRVAGRLVPGTKTIYNPECMLHGQIGIS